MIIRERLKYVVSFEGPSTCGAWPCKSDMFGIYKEGALGREKDRTNCISVPLGAPLGRSIRMCSHSHKMRHRIAI